MGQYGTPPKVTQVNDHEYIVCIYLNKCTHAHIHNEDLEYSTQCSQEQTPLDVTLLKYNYYILTQVYSAHKASIYMSNQEQHYSQTSKLDKLKVERKMQQIWTVNHPRNNYYIIQYNIIYYTNINIYRASQNSPLDFFITTLADEVRFSKFFH